MRTDRRTVVFLLAVGLSFGLSLGEAQAGDFVGDVDGESTDNSHDKWIEVEEWPNPMERRTDTSAPAMSPGTRVMPTEKAGRSEPAMKPGVTSQTGGASLVPGMPGATPGGPEIMDDGKHGKVYLKDGPTGMPR